MYRKMEGIQKEKKGSQFDFEHMETFLKYGIYPSVNFTNIFSMNFVNS